MLTENSVPGERHAMLWTHLARSPSLAIVQLLAAAATVLAMSANAAAQSQVVAWGNNNFGQCNVPAPSPGLNYVEVEAGGTQYGGHTVARLSDGSVVAWGNNTWGQCNPAAPYVDVAAGGSHTVARRANGKVKAWGNNIFGQCDVPKRPAGLDYVEVAAGGSHTVARLSDGSVVAWGNNAFGQCNVFGGYAEVAAGQWHTVARHSDGWVVAKGDNSSGQCNVPALPAGLTYVEVAAGGHHTVARLSDGSVVAWGKNSWGQCNVPALPPGLTYVEVAAGHGHTVARLSDGSVVAWGHNNYGQCNVPAPPPGLTYVEVAAGSQHTVARLGVSILLDIKPGSEPNSLNPASSGMIPVAILGSATFDVSTIDVTTLSFGPAGAAPAHSKGGHLGDVNGDGLMDLLSHYRTQETGIASGDTQACLTGQLFDAMSISGCDSIVVVSSSAGGFPNPSPSSLKTEFFRDEDGDGFGVTGDSKFKTKPLAPYTATVGGDCCDQDSAAFPGQTVYFSTPNNCGGYDYNCDDVWSRWWSSHASCTLVWQYECLGNPGWGSGVVPFCGASGWFSDSCDYSCQPDGWVFLTQGCR